jgi:heat shock protein HtpX
MERIKTVGLLTLLTVLFVWIGGMVGGQMGMIIAFIMAAGMNFYSYYFSDTMVLKHYRAIEVHPDQAHGLFDMVERLTRKADLPMPRIYIIPDRTPNAFATGRDPEHAVVAVTEGLLDLLDEQEVEGVIAHELSHIRHYDILIGTIAASIAGAISMIANFMHFGSMLGGNDNRPNPIIMLLLAIILPFAAMIIQMSVSRSREYVADEGAARMTGHPEWLQSALYKLDQYARGGQLQEATQETAHMFIINPFSGKHINFKSLFSTHPSTEDRIERLEALKRSI